MTWELGGLCGESGTALVVFLCLDLGEGCGEGPGEGWMSDCTGPAERGCLDRRGEGRGAIGSGGREWTAEEGRPPSRPKAELTDGKIDR